MVCVFASIISMNITTRSEPVSKPQASPLGCIAGPILPSGAFRYTKGVMSTSFCKYTDPRLVARDPLDDGILPRKKRLGVCGMTWLLCYGRLVDSSFATCLLTLRMHVWRRDPAAISNDEHSTRGMSLKRKSSQ